MSGRHASEPLIVTLLRHGEVEGPLFAFRGASDPPLTERGWMQMRSAMAVVTTPAVSAIVASPLIRCRAFAEEAATMLNAPLELEADLAEMRFGAWEGREAQDVQDTDAAALAAFRADPARHPPPGGEPFDAFAARVRTAFARRAREHTGHLLVVTHSGVIRALMADCLGLAATHLARFALPPAATCRLSLLEGEPPCLLALNFAAAAP